MKKQHIKLAEEDRITLTKIIDNGHQSGRIYKRALALLELNRGKTYKAVAETISMTLTTVSTLAKNYKAKGLECLNDKPRSGRPCIIDGVDRAKITALACSQPPAGYSQWSLRLLADKAVELAYVEHISHTEVAHILKKTT
jgi:putative transposase